MKLKHIQSNKTLIRYLTLVLLTALMTVLVNGFFSESASAKISYNDLNNRIGRQAQSYCAEVKNLNSPFKDAWYDDCIKTYQSTASVVFFGSQKQINRQIQEKCSIPTTPWTASGKSPCGAFATGATEAKNIIKNSGGQQNGGLQGGSGNNDGGNAGNNNNSQQSKPVPPKNECNKAENAQKQRECRRKYTACNPPPETREAAKTCKRHVINQYTGGGGSESALGGAQAVDGGGQGQSDQNQRSVYDGRYLCGNIRTEDNGTSGPLSDDNYYTKFNFGCVGERGPPGLNPIEDLAFAFLRFLSIGVGIAVVLAIVGSGIQYTTSEGNAEVTTKAKKRIRSAAIGLLVYIFAFSLFQYLVPGGIFWPGNWLNVEIITRLL